MAITLNPYLYFKGDARAAMELYRSVFGGELSMQTYEEVKMDAPPGGNKDWLMHAKLEGDVAIMASDTGKASPVMAKASLSLGSADEGKMRKIFDELSTDGKVFMPLQKQFWGDIFGSFTDKFGVEWNVNIEAARE